MVVVASRSQSHVKDPQAAVRPSLDPDFLVRSAMHPHRHGRNTDGEIEPIAAGFLGIAGLAAPSVPTTA